MFPTWKKFLESKMCDIEDVEEKLGKDIDNDNEEGESLAHKKKVLGKKAEKAVEDKPEAK